MELIKDFLEDYGEAVVMSFLMIMALSLLMGQITISFMFLGVAMVTLSIWFFWMHGRAAQVLMEIWFGKIQVKTKQKLLMKPQFFIIRNADYNHSKVYKVEKESEECKKVVRYMMKSCHQVDVRSDIYLDSATGIKLIDRSKFVRFCSCQLSDFLQSGKVQYIEQCGSIITLKSTSESEPLCFFLKSSKSVLDVAFNKHFQEVMQMYQKGMDLQTEEIYNQYGDEIYFLDMPDTAIAQCQEEKQKEPSTPCPNPDILDRIRQVDEKLEQGMQLSGISNSQWKNVVQPNLMNVINKKELNKKNKNEILDILNQVEKTWKWKKKKTSKQKRLLRRYGPSFPSMGVQKNSSLAQKSKK